MKLIDIFTTEKSNYPDAIIFIKSGKFYTTFDNDALIISYLFSYKKINNKVGFPENSLENVCEKLKEVKINYVVYEEDNYFDEENNYYEYLKKSNDNLVISNMCDSLMKNIKSKVLDDFDNYKKIKDFIHEL